jgi:hypothetical protein
MGRVHIALFTNGYPHVDAAIRAMDLSHRHGASFSRTIGEPLSLRRDQFARWFVETDASHVLMLEGDVVPPEDALGRLLEVGAPVVTAVYPQWVDERLCSNVQALTDATWSERIPSGRFPIRRCLLGCVLVTREALLKIPAPWFLSTMTETRFVTDDEWFCAAVSRAGLSIICDGNLSCAAFRQGTDLRSLARLQRSHSGSHPVAQNTRAGDSG